MLVRSRYPDVSIPALSVTRYVLRHAERLADKPALIDAPTGRTLTYGQLAAGIRRVAAGLAARGFGKGDVLAMLAPNCPEYALVFHGVGEAGGAVTTLNPLYTEEEITNQLRDSRARYLITIEMFREKALAAAAQAGLEEVFLLGEGGGEGTTPFAALLAHDGPPPHIQWDYARDLIALPYSSGTTGLPKGVMLTHRNLVANMCQSEGFGGVDQLGEGDVVAAVLPFFHIYGMQVLLNYALAHGATVVSMPRFDLTQFLSMVQEHKVTYAPLVPPIVLGLAKSPLVDQYDLSSLKRVGSGGAPLGEALALQASARLSCPVTQGYGLTETSPTTHIGPTTPELNRPAACGLTIPNTETKIVDIVSGAMLPQGEQGEVCVRGPQVMLGYLNRPEATAEVIDAEAWFHTGDIGYVDQDGYLYVVDRLKELIKYKGFQVAPAELEALLLAHPAVADAAVIPSPDEEAGEVPKAFIVLRGEATADPLMADVLMAYVAEHVAPHKRIRLMDIVGEIPKSASGKILRRVLVAQERERMAG